MVPRISMPIILTEYKSPNLPHNGYTNTEPKNSQNNEANTFTNKSYAQVMLRLNTITHICLFVCSVLQKRKCNCSHVVVTKCYEHKTGNIIITTRKIGCYFLLWVSVFMPDIMYIMREASISETLKNPL